MSAPAAVVVSMMRGVRLRLLVGILLLAAGPSVHAQDFWQGFKKKIDEIKNAAPANLPQVERARQAVRALAGFSQEEEVAIGRKATGNLLGAAALVKNPPLQNYVNQVGRWIASQSERPDLDWRFGVIESKDVNAYAAPGGYVLVTRGLYQLLRNESELAGVLAHEIAHVVKKHHLKVLEQSRLLDKGRDLLGNQAVADEQIKKLIGSGAEIFSRALDKDAEYEADRLAMVLAARAGYDPFGLPMVLQDLALVSKDHGRVSQLFKTHPLPDERLAELEETGARLEGSTGKTSVARFIRLRP